MKAGTIIKFEDGRMATLVYHYLDGYGAAFGMHALDPNDEKSWPEKDIMLEGMEFEIVSVPGR